MRPPAVSYEWLAQSGTEGFNSSTWLLFIETLAENTAGFSRAVESAQISSYP